VPDVAGPGAVEHPLNHPCALRVFVAAVGLEHGAMALVCRRLSNGMSGKNEKREREREREREEREEREERKKKTDPWGGRCSGRTSSWS